PAQASGEGSRKSTLTVSPTLKLSTLPTGRHRGGNRRTKGPIMNPMIGTATSSDANPIRTRLALVIKTRRSGLNASPRLCAVSVAMHEFSNPVDQRNREQHASSRAKCVRRDQAEKDESGAQRHHRRLIGRRGRPLGLRNRPSFRYPRCVRALFSHRFPLASSARWSNAETV